MTAYEPCVTMNNLKNPCASLRKASVSKMLHNLGWQSLDGRWQDQRLVFLQNY